MPETTIKNISDLAPVLRRADEFIPKAMEEFQRSMQESVLILEREVVERTPVGVGDGAQGHLRGTIFSEVRGTTLSIRGSVASFSDHALYVEDGTRPHWAPKGSLNSYVRLMMNVEEKDVPRVEFLVRRKIARVGTKGHKMFAQGWVAAEGRIRARFIRAFRDAVKRVYGAS